MSGKCLCKHNNGLDFGPKRPLSEIYLTLCSIVPTAIAILGIIQGFARHPVGRLHCVPQALQLLFGGKAQTQVPAVGRIEGARDLRAQREQP